LRGINSGLRKAVQLALVTVRRIVALALTERKRELCCALPMIKLRHVDIEAVIFDLDGVITRTARVHARAWKAASDLAEPDAAA
jgi:hypothetical protein